ncbi:MAG: Nif3-like dinuclear metal center hexameric protein [Bacteroidales bacterium]|jgi:dinuclear metal center YbgI/SA1388 family protein|nr:Nif3-like dinuclear metal center hexameric protein [Bacteroidales bacterium]
MAVTLAEFVRWLEGLIPPSFQEDYDNSGLQVGDNGASIGSILLSVDVTPEVIGEAALHGCNLVLSHHPLIFRPLKRVAYGSNSEICVAEALKRGIAVYSAHTSLDNAGNGVSHILARKIGLEGIGVLEPLKGRLLKLVTFVPESHAGAVRDALFGAGAGHIGNYDRCSFNLKGEGTYRAGEGADPFAGGVGEYHSEPEVRIEVVLPSHLKGPCVKAMLSAHPYEEVAWDLISLENEYTGAGAGAIGTLPAPLAGAALLQRLRELTGLPVIRYSGDPARTVTKVAVCGGAGSYLISSAVRAGADAFITGDIKYHAFTEAPADMLVADIGHYESEKFALEILYNLIQKKFPNFALRFSGIKTNPINYYGYDKTDQIS